MKVGQATRPLGKTVDQRGKGLEQRGLLLRHRRRVIHHEDQVELVRRRGTHRDILTTAIDRIRATDIRTKVPHQVHSALARPSSVRGIEPGITTIRCRLCGSGIKGCCGFRLIITTSQRGHDEAQTSSRQKAT